MSIKNSFELQLNEFAKKAGNNAGLVVKKVCFDLTASVVMKTPVDTGRLRANWQASTGYPNPQTVGEPDSPAAGASEAIAKAQTAINAAPGTVFYLVNNLPYAVPIEYGHSTQAPSGMVRITMTEIRNSLTGF